MFNEIANSAFIDEMEKIASTTELIRKPVTSFIEGLVGHVHPQLEQYMGAFEKATGERIPMHKRMMMKGMINNPSIPTEVVMHGAKQLEGKRPGSIRDIVKFIGDSRREGFKAYGGRQAFNAEIGKAKAAVTPELAPEIMARAKSISTPEQGQAMNREFSQRFGLRQLPEAELSKLFSSHKKRVAEFESKHPGL